MNAERFLHSFSMIGEAPARIQQLRRVAVALAVAGKLGSGKATLSPREMMHAVEQVKEDLFRRRAIPKPKKLKAVEDDELPEGFPDSTRFAPLGSLARVEKGLTGIKQAQSGPFPLVVTGAYRASCDHFDFEGAAAVIPLVSSTGHGHASLNRLHYQEGKFALGTILAAVFPYDPKLISARFIFEYLSAFKEELLVTRMTGTANVTLSVGRISEVPVPLIDPTTQAKVDELMALLDRLEAARAAREATRDRLTTASLVRLTAPDTTPEVFPAHARFALDALPALTSRSDQIKSLRQTILNLAVRGKLVEQDPDDEPASELVKRIAIERELVPKTGRSGKKKIIDPSLTALPFTLPDGWELTMLSELVRVVNGRAYKKTELLDEGTPVLRVGNLFTSDHWYYSNLELEDDKYCEKGDLIYAWSASFGPFIWDGQRAIYHYHIWKLPLFSEADLDKQFLYLFLLQKTREIKDAGHGISMVHMTKEKMEQLAVPLPPLAEQHRIVAKVDALMVLCDRLEAALATTDITKKRLLEALLHEALEPTLKEAA